ncbi:sigma-70 family RNA polymerase sigma factor [Arachidicoccus ginsenosidivorans]|uniref:Sigma-70 family RNA polymerase sigma factor n=1 Tax=Arachidicoccus ginsenosidivorans TaxID=496057 RepID=A0A5B8VIQ7_9BACT|nr:sigma-70 family RNA polymerase sigma factor [Arachidicoccus ginsenosidivorans]QEC71380.1 sigma-70 family RNA polymerase sigma factor [Arachidicoccus ginsenosidivorans]
MQDRHLLSDAVLMEQLVLDQAWALREIFDRYWERLYGMAYNRLGTEQGAEDVVQEVLSALWIRRHEVKIDHLGKYLSAAVKYAVFYEIRKAQKRRVTRLNTDQDHIVNPGFTPEDALLFKGFTRQLESEINSLPEKCRLVFQYSREEGLTNKQIAEKLQISNKTVEAHISRAIRHLKTVFKGPGSFISF